MDEKFNEYAKNTNENVCNILSKAKKLKEVSKKGYPIYLLKDPLSKKYLKFILRQGDLEMPNMDFDIKESLVRDVLSDYPAISTFVSTLSVKEGKEEVDEKISYLIVFDTSYIKSRKQKSFIINHELGHCINDDVMGEEDGSVPLSYVLQDNPSYIMDAEKEIVEETFLRLKKEVRADLYSYNKTKQFLDWQMVAKGTVKRSKKLIKLFDNIFTSVIKSEDGINSYNALKEGRLNNEENYIETLEILTQYLIRSQALAYQIKNGSLEGFKYIEPPFMKVK